MLTYPFRDDQQLSKISSIVRKKKSETERKNMRRGLGHILVVHLEKNPGLISGLPQGVGRILNSYANA